MCRFPCFGLESLLAFFTAFRFSSPVDCVLRDSHAFNTCERQSKEATHHNSLDEVLRAAYARTSRFSSTDCAVLRRKSENASWTSWDMRIGCVRSLQHIFTGKVLFCIIEQLVLLEVWLLLHGVKAAALIRITFAQP